MHHAGKRVLLRKDMKALLKFAMRHFTILPAIAVFLAAAALVLMGFFSYNAWNISCGVTGNDRHKISELNRKIVLEVCSSCKRFRESFQWHVAGLYFKSHMRDVRFKHSQQRWGVF
jgi:hypothetical protein